MEKVHKNNHQLFTLISNLESPEEVAKFFEDLCTNKELISLEQRLDVAMYLEQGFPYLKIMSLTGASSATISRVRRYMLEDGSGGVMKNLIEKYELNIPSEEDDTEETESSDIES